MKLIYPSSRSSIREEIHGEGFDYEVNNESVGTFESLVPGVHLFEA